MPSSRHLLFLGAGLGILWLVVITAVNAASLPVSGGLLVIWGYLLLPLGASAICGYRFAGRSAILMVPIGWSVASFIIVTLLTALEDDRASSDSWWVAPAMALIITVPVGFVMVGLAMLSQALSPRMRASARDQAGLCRMCGYDLTGLPAGTCPECGESLVQQDIPRSP